MKTQKQPVKKKPSTSKRITDSATDGTTKMLVVVTGNDVFRVKYKSYMYNADSNTLHFVSVDGTRGAFNYVEAFYPDGSADVIRQ